MWLGSRMCRGSTSDGPTSVAWLTEAAFSPPNFAAHHRQVPAGHIRSRILSVPFSMFIYNTCFFFKLFLSHICAAPPSRSIACLSLRSLLAGVSPSPVLVGPTHRTLIRHYRSRPPTRPHLLPSVHLVQEIIGTLLPHAPTPIPEDRDLLPCSGGAARPGPGGSSRVARQHEPPPDGRSYCFRFVAL